MYLFDLRNPIIIGLIDALMLILAIVFLWSFLGINLFGSTALLYFLALSVIAGWRGAAYARLIPAGKADFWKAATEGFIWGAGIMLVLQAGVTPFQWQLFITIGMTIAVVTGVIGAMVGASILLMNRMIVRVGNTSYSKRGGIIVLLVLFVAIGGALPPSVIKLIQTGTSISSRGPANMASSVQAASGAFTTYQSVIGKVLPGYTIFRNEDFLQDENRLRSFLTPIEIATSRARSLGVIEGRFNEDVLPDFAALAINRSIKQEAAAYETDNENRRAVFSVRLVICLGTKQAGDYQCDILSTLDGDFVSLPYWVEFEVFKAPGEFSCGDVDNQVTVEDTSVQAFYPEGWSGKEGAVQLGVAARRLHLNYDGVGIYAIGRNYGWTLVRQADGSYLNCANAD